MAKKFRVDFVGSALDSSIAVKVLCRDKVEAKKNPALESTGLSLRQDNRNKLLNFSVPSDYLSK